MDAAFEARLRAIREDRASGAAALAREAAAALIGVADGPRAELEEAARALARAQPAMAPLLRLADAALASADPVAACREFVTRMEESARKVAGHGAAVVRPGGTVLTHSFSATVLEALQQARPERVIVTESQPGGEGLALADALTRAVIPVRVISDTAVYGWLAQAHVALVGADAVSSGGVTNKIGTALVALAGRELRVPVYCLCGSEKFLPRRREPAIEPRDPYFETTPLALFAGVVTEEGVLREADVWERLAAIELQPGL